MWTLNGDPISPFLIEWGENEPVDTPGATCASISQSVDYKLRAAGCFEQKHFLCSPLKPKCPNGFEAVQQYGSGKSCFKIVGPVEAENPTTGDISYDLTLADMMCHKYNTRIFAPESALDITALITWLNDLAGLITDPLAPIPVSPNQKCLINFKLID